MNEYLVMEVAQQLQEEKRILEKDIIVLLQRAWKGEASRVYIDKVKELMEHQRETLSFLLDREE